MSQNRNKLITLFIGNITNAIVHEILEKAIENKEIANKYRKEISTSFDKAREYREKINPANKSLPEKDIEEIKNKIINKVKSELKLRISKGYEGIDLNLVERLVEEFLRKTNVI